MKRLLYLLMFLSSAAFVFPVRAGLTEDELKPFEKLLPMKLTPKAVSEWVLDTEYKSVHYTLDVKSMKAHLRKKEFEKLRKRKKVRLRIAGDVYVTKPGKSKKQLLKGAVYIYIILSGDTPKIVSHKKVKLAKLCPC